MAVVVVVVAVLVAVVVNAGERKGNTVTGLIFADYILLLVSVENALNIIVDFGRIAGLQLNMKKTKAIWLGKWANSKSNPLGMKWMRCPVKILGAHFSYDEKSNNELNFNLKLRKIQTLKTGYVEYERSDIILIQILMCLMEPWAH